MWDVLSFDFDVSIEKEDVLKNVIDNAETGSIILFHDSLKAQEKVKYTLPQVLEFFSKKGFTFDKL
jgi:peptidoglycan/xylan/chitin deacetylase (PgdA/CDA1 family)